MQSLDVGTAVRRIFPEGTQNFRAGMAGSDPDWPPVPDFPPDLFAAAAYLLEIAGAYHYFVANDQPPNWTGRPAFIDPDEHLRWIEAGAAWLRTPKVPPLVVDLWARLGMYRSSTIFKEHRPNVALEPWWDAAMALAIIADEACAELGYGVPAGSAGSTTPGWIFNAWFAPQSGTLSALVDKAAASGRHHVTFFPQTATVCQKADPDVVCVQPKSRTPSLGCTLRTLSHNLALLPPRGVVRACWQRPPETPAPDDAASMNLLLIPYPFQLSATLFSGEVRLSPAAALQAASLAGSPPTKPWGWFDVAQRWLHGGDGLTVDERIAEVAKRRTALIEFVSKLVETAMADVGKLHGVVFPEYALDWETHEALADHMADRYPSIEFLVSGSSNNCKGEHANTALSSVFVRGGSSSGSAGSDYTISTSRPKHHRWRLDEHQISTYALASSLDPRVLWWEKTLLPKRDIHINVFRESSTFATMICEDLARVDPCHAVLRSVAPSLVFVLLMDGPQLPSRWPARYATVLADDPGSSVLTLTSVGLIERANRTGRRDGSRSVALWKEDTGRTEEIVLPEGSHGVVLTLSGYRTMEVTLDGRPNNDGRAWRYHGHQPVRYRAGNDHERDVLDLMTSAV